jgi:acetyl esterase/lipase
MPLITDLAPFEALLNLPSSTPPVVYTPLEGGDPTRTQLFFYLLQTARAVDVFTGVEGLSQRLLRLPREERDDAVPPEARGAVPHLGINGAYPPTFMLHGDRDSVVPIEESRNMLRALREKGVEAKLAEIEGAFSSFSFLPFVRPLTDPAFHPSRLIPLPPSSSFPLHRPSISSPP